MVLFVGLAVALIVLLAWATRPPKPVAYRVHDIFEVLAQQGHCTRLRFILQALEPMDTEYLRDTGNTTLMHALRAQRRRIALHYLDQLQDEFETLLEISRAMAVMAPEVIAVEEMERWRLSLLFALNCAVLRWRLRLGLRPTARFAAISNMATGMVWHLEAATTSIAENAMHGTEFSGFNAEKHEDN
jgi:hypothetical protein